MKMDFIAVVARAVSLFLMQLFICEIGFVVSLPRKNHFSFRLIRALMDFLVLIVADNALRILLPGNDSYLLSHLKGIAYFVLIVLSNALLIWECFQVKYTEALFIVIGGYSVEHIASRFSYILKAFLFAGGPVPPVVEYGVFDFLIPIAFSAAFYFTLIRESIAAKRFRYDDKMVLVVSGLNLFICIALSIFEPSVGDGSMEAILVISSNYGCAILACVLCLLLQAGIFHASELDDRNRTLTEMLKVERDKQILSQETIDIINRKCHDLRHQIALLERQTPEEREKSLKNISDAILIYDSIAKTGNASVDLVLMEKKLFCEKYHIQFTYLVDGEQFDFMDDADIYSMLGNMLENAIESVIREQDLEKRIIMLIAQSRNGMLYISMENYCAAKVDFQEGLPKTGKEDKAFHGYGTKSIAYIVQSYGGDVRFLTENNRFIVEILLPLQGETADNRNLGRI